MNHCLPPSDPTLSDQERREIALAGRGPNEARIIHNPNIWGFLQPIGISENTLDTFDFSTRIAAHVIELNYSTRDGRNLGKHALGFSRRDSNSPAVLRNLSKRSTVLVNLHEIQKGETCILEGEDRIRILRGNGTIIYEFLYRDAFARANKGEVFENYFLSHVLGNGGYATVFSAAHRLTGVSYAVKKITRLPDTPSYEISCMQKLYHPRICELKEVFFHQDNSIYLVTELCRGGNLLDYIKKRGCLDEGIAREITFQMCNTMEFVHTCDIVHRDLKPENILVDSENPLRIKITDFGLSKSPGLHGLLKSTKGSELYIAPEVFGYRNYDQAYDKRVDSWSVGAIVVAMLTGYTPYRPRSTPEAENESFQERVFNRELTLVCLEEKGYHRGGNAFQFARCLLREDPVVRATFTQALRLPWLIDMTKKFQIYMDELQENQLRADARVIHGIRP